MRARVKQYGFQVARTIVLAQIIIISQVGLKSSSGRAGSGEYPVRAETWPVRYRNTQGVVAAELRNLRAARQVDQIWARAQAHRSAGEQEDGFGL